jgi:hypothetical protein
MCSSECVESIFLPLSITTTVSLKMKSMIRVVTRVIYYVFYYHKANFSLRKSKVHSTAICTHLRTTAIKNATEKFNCVPSSAAVLGSTHIDRLMKRHTTVLLAFTTPYQWASERQNGPPRRMEQHNWPAEQVQLKEVRGKA